MPGEAAVSPTSDEEKSSDAIATAKPVSSTSSEKSRDHAVDEPRECTALMIEQRGEGRGDAAAPPPPPSSTCDCLRQLWLLTRKNFILTRRNKLWTFFELVLPIIFMLPIAILIARSDKVALTPALVFKPVPLKGSAEDVTLNLPAYSSAPTIWDEWCNRLSVPIAYVARKNQDDVEKVITKLTERYSSSDITIDWVKMDKEEDMLNKLREDAANITDQHCGINKFAGGVLFKQFDTKAAVLDYAILKPVSFIAIFLDPWHLDEEWDNPFGINIDHDSIPTKPPYWSSGFLSLQYAIDSLFIQASSSNVTFLPELSIRRIPEPKQIIKSVAGFLNMSHYFWGFCAFVLVIHTAREIAGERSTVKDFLSVMGLSRTVFYLSHVLYGLLKILLVFLVCAAPLLTKMGSVSVPLFVVVLVLYGVSAVVFAAFMSSLFKKPNTVLKVTIVLWIVMVVVVYWAPRVEQILYCTLFSINPHAAFAYAIMTMADYLGRDRDLSFLNIFEDISYRFNAGAALVMLLLDIIWMSAATLFFDYIFSDSDFTFFKFLCCGKYKRSSVAHLEEDGGNNETDEGLMKTRAGISVQNLIKVWSSTGERAVDDLSLQAYVGQVTALLGQNGAGKSTTFSVICGITAPTSGRVCIDDLDVKKQLSACRKYIGLCPQANALFDRLTVNEHLWLIHGLKGAKGSYEDEAKQLLDQLKLDEKSDEYAKNLSGGQKRKLCMSMAVIGDSPVILLDEPTAGMDPRARRDVETLLETIKVDRTVLLTTHYLDEAELLGDRIAIMAKGRVYCCGTPQFLKKRFASGYIMTVVVVEKANAHDVAESFSRIAGKYVPGAEKGHVHGKQFEITLPKEHQKNFPELFEYMENSKDSLQISSFGLALNTLEQVFLKVAESTDPTTRSDFMKSKVNRNEDLVQAQQVERSVGCTLTFARLRALFTKRFMYCIRNWSQLITQVLTPLGILLLIVLLSLWEISISKGKVRSFSAVTFGPSRVPVKVEHMSPIVDTYLGLVSKVPGVQTYKLMPRDQLIEWAERLPKKMPPAGYGAVFARNSVEVLFTSRAYHSLPSSLNAYDNAQLKVARSDGIIHTQLQTLTPNISILGIDDIGDKFRLLSPEVVDRIIGPFLVLALAFATSPFVIYLVEERVSKFAHQQSLTGISPLLFWAGSFFFDFLLYSVVCACCLVVFLFRGWMKGYLGFVILLFALYFWSCVPFIYAVSFMFTAPSKANVLLIVWQLVAPILALLILILIGTMGNIEKSVLEFAQSVLQFLLPSYAFGGAVMTVGAHSSQKLPQSKLWEWESIGKNMVFMLIFGFLSSLLFLMLQFKSIRYQCFKVWNLRYALKSSDKVAIIEEDPAVAEERVNVQESREDMALEVKDLCKMYGRLKAVDGLTMGVRDGECFGLLGPNGAGKTSTFDILTGQSFATDGSAVIGGQDVKEHIPIGYCPQFDALLLDLTGRETLEILARMHGFPSPREIVELLLQSVSMEDQADKLLRYCSGGQRRKISVALALLTPARIIILDEPTAGIDPKARRQIWELLSMMRESLKLAILLTSHSMDECEALCSRIAILLRGKMIAIGTSQELKSKFGKSYTIVMVAPDVESRSKVIDAVSGAYPTAVLKTPKGSLTLSLKWQIPKSESDRWSTLFRDVQELATSLGVLDFCVTQSTFEETFLRLAEGEQKEPDLKKSKEDSDLKKSKEEPDLKKSKEEPDLKKSKEERQSPSSDQ